MADSQKPPPPTQRRGTPFAEMTPGRKFLFIAKLAICIVTFGLAFPNVMGD